MRTKILRRVAPIAAATGLALGAAPVAAEADTGAAAEGIAADAPFRLYNSGSGRCLIDTPDLSGAWTGSCTSGRRYWRGVEDVWGGRVVNTTSGRCLTDKNGSALLMACTGAYNQMWYHLGYGLVQNVASGKCLQGATGGGGTWMSACNTSNTYQRWGTLS
ncbi:RICIN domain-containing protein [Actinomadura sp. WMMA1423]|uniref:RICIN domain-containing protein n=1 Tax=Actinomadura sp. WMMA1423 TaxID=2591108 RepID=UPI001146711C|nr:RICIN domain-containing protein [Actinomadura sp. WMMA1423]